MASYSNRTGVREEKGHRVASTHRLHVDMDTQQEDGQVMMGTETGAMRLQA